MTTTAADSSMYVKMTTASIQGYDCYLHVNSKISNLPAIGDLIAFHTSLSSCFVPL
jgi:hypothetical protein